MLSDLEVPQEPRTTFSLATMKGGSSVNAIVEHAECEVDLRSEDAQELDRLVKEALPLFELVVQLENARRRVTDPSLQITCKVTPIGYRPAGGQKSTSPVVLQVARAAQEALGIEMTAYTSPQPIKTFRCLSEFPQQHLTPAAGKGSTTRFPNGMSRFVPMKDLRFVC